MKSFFTFATLVITFGFCIHFAESKRHNPKHDEIERIINETHSILWKCTGKRQCDQGYGLSFQCGSSVSINDSIKCVPCVEGKSYSDVKDHSVCKMCSFCGHNQRKTGQCTLTADNITCLKQCKKEYYWDEVRKDCHPCHFCCNNSKGNVEQDCIDSGLPPQQQCRETLQTCAPPASQFSTEENVEERGTSGAKKKLKPTKPAKTSSLSLKVGLGVGLPPTALIILCIVLKISGRISQVRTYLFKFFCFCCNSYPLGTNTAMNRVYFNCPENDVEATLLDDGVTFAGNSSGKADREEAPNTSACSKNKFCRLLSCPANKESNSERPKFCKAHSYPGCLPELKGSCQEPMDSIHEEGFDVDKLSAQDNNNLIRRSEQHIFQDQSPAISESCCGAVTSEVCSQGIATEQSPLLPPPLLLVPTKAQSTSTTGLLSSGTELKVLADDTCQQLMNKKVHEIPNGIGTEQPPQRPPLPLPVPSKAQSTSTTGLLSSGTELKVPDDYRQQLMNKKVAEIPLKFYGKICNSLAIRRDSLFDDYRLFGENIGLTRDQTELLGQKESTGHAMMQMFCSQKDRSIGKLKEILEDMERFDISDIIEEWVQESFRELMVSSQGQPKISVTV